MLGWVQGRPTLQRIKMSDVLFACGLCGFSTYDKKLMWRHLRCGSRDVGENCVKPVVIEIFKD